MAKQAANRPWWEELKLDNATARLVAERGADSPAELAGLARTVPDDFRRTFSSEARADLSNALAAQIAKDSSNDAGFRELLAALEELAGKQPPKAMVKPPAVKFGVALSPVPDKKLPPLPKLGKLGPGD